MHSAIAADFNIRRIIVKVRQYRQGYSLTEINLPAYRGLGTGIVWYLKTHPGNKEKIEKDMGVWRAITRDYLGNPVSILRFSNQTIPEPETYQKLFKPKPN